MEINLSQNPLTHSRIEDILSLVSSFFEDFESQIRIGNIMSSDFNFMTLDIRQSSFLAVGVDCGRVHFGAVNGVVNAKNRAELGKKVRKL
jgi:hypothetical protein